MGILNSVFKTFHKIVNGGTDVLKPVEGISFEEWVKANSKLASGTNTAEIIKTLGIDLPRWDRVNNEWLTRLKNDKTYTLSMKYAGIFNNHASGNLPCKKEITEDTYPFEKYVEVMAAMDYLGKQGRDAQDVLKDFGLTTADYSNLSSFWSKKLMLSPLGLGMKMQKLMMEYREKYQKLTGEGTAHDDIRF